MIDFENVDFDEAKAWLETLTHQQRVWFAVRSALRVLPIVEIDRDGDTKVSLAFFSLRAMLISGAASTCSAPEMRSLTAAAAARSAAARSALDAARSAAARSAAAAALSATATAALDAARSAAAAALSADSAATLHAALSADSAALQGWPSLWVDEHIPDEIADMWSRLKGILSQDHSTWDFWIRWYEGCLYGKPLDWELVFRIATELTEADWDAGPEHVAERIREIEAEFLLNRLPQVEEIFETKTGLYDVKSGTTDPSALVASVLSRVEFAFDTAVESNTCDLNAMSVAAKVLRHALTKCADDPNALEQYLRNASDLIKDRLADESFGADEALDLLTQTLDETSLQLRADHPDVGQASQARIKQRLSEINDKKRLAMARQISEMQEGATGRLTDEFQIDAEITKDGSSGEATAEAIKRSGNRAGKVSLMERAKKAEGSGAMATAKIGLRAEKFASWVIDLLNGSGGGGV